MKAKGTKLPATDLSQEPKIQTVNDIMVQIQTEVEALKSGDLPIDKARAVTSMRKLQLQGVSLHLQAARIEARMRPIVASRFGLLPEPRDLKPEPKQVTGKEVPSLQ